MKLVVGLGNPGRKYDETRHNIGWEVLFELMRRHPGAKPKTKFKGEVCEVQLGNEAVLLLTPHTFMNLSGASVLAASDFYKIPPENILVVCDDLHLPLGRLRLRPNGSAGGQKGLENILQRLGTQSVGRLRLGIGESPPGWDVADYVLSQFQAEEKDEIMAAVTKAAGAVTDWAQLGMAECMNRYNADPQNRKKENSPVDGECDAEKKNKES